MSVQQSKKFTSADHTKRFAPAGYRAAAGRETTSVVARKPTRPKDRAGRTRESTYRSDDECWAAVVGRDGRADGRFVYCVSTTGVYCRPGCSSRLPRREHVRFCRSVQAAERAGYRPCKRCRPELIADRVKHRAAIIAACRCIEAADVAPPLETLACAAGLSRYHFSRVFKAVVGVTPKAYATSVRNGRLRAGLGAAATVTDAVYGAGFGSSGRFYAQSATLLGMHPKRFRDRGRGEIITYALDRCALGTILIAATAKGVCVIALGDDPQALEHDLRERFSAATLARADRALAQRMRQAIALIESPARAVPLPLDIRGTAFQQRVWLALRGITPGTTLSYADIAKQIGAPRALRAVGHACAVNPLAVAVPCHRAIRSDGSLAGYRWGIERKRALLEREKPK